METTQRIRFFFLFVASLTLFCAFLSVCLFLFMHTYLSIRLFTSLSLPRSIKLPEYFSTGLAVSVFIWLGYRLEKVYYSYLHMFYHHQCIQIRTCTEMIPQHLSNRHWMSSSGLQSCIHQHLTEIRKNNEIKGKPITNLKTTKRIWFGVLFSASYSPAVSLAICLVLMSLFLSSITHILSSVQPNICSAINPQYISMHKCLSNRLLVSLFIWLGYRSMCTSLH